MNKIPGITQIEGKKKFIEIEGNKYLIFPILHPSAIIYQRSKQLDWFKRGKQIRKILNTLK